MTNKKTSVGIIGAGISGLSTAYALSQKGIGVTVYEQSDQPGGAMHSKRQENWLVEEGPNTLMVKSQEMWDLLNELNLDDKVVEANQVAKKRFVAKDGEPIALPMSAGQFLTTSLLSVGGKLRLLKEPFAAASDKDDESIATFIERRLGKQVLDYGVNPFISGIYAGDPKKLSIKHTFSKLWQIEQEHGSLLKGMFKKKKSGNSAKRALISFKDGTQTLPGALADALPHPVQTSTEITSVKKQTNGWQITAANNGTTFTGEHDCLVSTIPAYVLPNIFEANFLSELTELPYAPVSVLGLGFKSKQINHLLDGFGMLVPEKESYNILGCLFSSTLFEGRAPNGHQLLTCFMGGARNPELALKSQQELQRIAIKDLDELLGIEGEPEFVHHKQWKKAIPQYELGHDHYLSIIKEAEKEFSGLYFDGNFRGGVSVPNCITSGFETAQKVEKYMQSGEK